MLITIRTTVRIAESRGWLNCDGVINCIRQRKSKANANGEKGLHENTETNRTERLKANVYVVERVLKCTKKVVYLKMKGIERSITSKR